MVLPLAVLLTLSLLLSLSIALKCRSVRLELERLSAHAAEVHRDNARMAGRIGSLLEELEELQSRLAATRSPEGAEDD